MAKNIAMSVAKQIIRQWCNKTPVKTVARNVGVSRNTVKRYLSVIRSQELDCQKLLAMEDEALEAVFTKQSLPGSRYAMLEKQLAHFATELNKTGVTRWLLWQEYKEKHPDGYQYSRFNTYLNKYLGTHKATLHIEQKPGDKFYIDFAGKKLRWIDLHTGEVHETEVFVAILGHSQLTYVEAIPSQKQTHFLGAIANALEYIGGVPKAIVPDNLKAAVIESDRYEPKINEALSDLANHYETVIYPTRSYKPRDKAWVENVIRTIYTRVYAPLRNREFHSLLELNHAIKEQLKKHNNQPFQKQDVSRRERFEKQEQEHLSPLPQSRYEHKQFRWQTAMKNSHVHLKEDKHYYSIPFRYIGRKVKVVFTQSYVAVYHSHQRIAFHKRDFRAFRYSTRKEHLPSHHRFVLDWCPEKFLGWAAGISPEVKAYIQVILDSTAYPEQAYKSCVGILGLAKKVGSQRLAEACKRAAFFQAYSYKTIKGILNSGLEKQQPKTPEQIQLQLPEHENIRGAECYQ